MPIKTYPIFLVSSYELQPERVMFENFIRRQNKRLVKKNVMLELADWEDMGAELNNGRKQDDYNKILNKTEIVVVLFWTKMGKYTYGHCAYLFCELGILNAIMDDGLGLELQGMDEEEKIKMIQRKLNGFGDETLLFLDNANDPDNIQQFLMVFFGFNGNILITSRCREALPNTENEILLGHLDPKDAKALFMNYYHEENHEFEELLDKLLKAIKYHTLLVEVFSKNLGRASARGIDLKSFLEKFDSEGIVLERRANTRLETDYAFHINKQVATPNDILEVLYDFSDLNEDERYHLVNIALLPIDAYRQKFLAEMFEPESETLFYETIGSLFQKGWIGGAYDALRLSPVVQKLVLHKNQEDIWEDGKA